ncbi:hypothetical protein Q7C18_07350 [Nesterenkonia sp. CL21]|uniref:hypothetical protein n=1 Tax=Nesterenkonia sp. CL21 TaxID=3064894 RepID=UPI0028794E5A|nr:hypothetical protein [Nesterenkonia sp. CL21]MDS2172504.1 hypothetical protein [Nesterenkonia sp. CL21]
MTDPTVETLKNSPHDAVQSIVAAAQAAADALDSREEEIAQLRKERDEARAQATLIRSAASLALSSIPQVVDSDPGHQSGPNAPEPLAGWPDRFVAELLALGEDPEVWTREVLHLAKVGLRAHQVRSLAQYFAREGATTVPGVPAPDPEPDTESELWNPQCDDVGVTTRFCGYELIPAVPARFGGAHWFRMDGECWPHGNRGARPDEVTVRRAMVVSP